MLEQADEHRLRVAMAAAKRASAKDFLTGVVGNAFPESARLTFDHAAVLIFPACVDDVEEFCANAGYDVSEPFPSVVVRDRLAHRYRLRDQDLDVTIVRGYPQRGTRQGLEIFMLFPGLPSICDELAARERVAETEAHLAWTVDGDDIDVVWRRCLQLGMRPDGGGYAPDHPSSTGGCTVLYFRPQPNTPAAEQISRMELIVEGHHAGVLAEHRSAAAAAEVPDSHTVLLSVLAGHWAARAVHVAAKMGLADVLNAKPCGATEVAERTGSAPIAVARLLRYLEWAGMVRQLGDGSYVNTNVGDLLRVDNPFNDLARLYGREFYHAWSEFGSTMRTGETAFRHRYGVEHFDYFARHPEDARTFDRSMQAVTGVIADELARTYRFPDGATVIDIGGGNGTLMRAVLDKHPTVTCVVFDRDHVAAHATTLHRNEGRFSSVAGDFFTEVPPGGDVYVLSRVLHDWSDEDCELILANCRAACEAGTTILVLERHLPEAGAPPRSGELAALWDLQMLAVTGGRERQRSEYEKLLLDAGFRVEAVHTLPVDMNLLVATAF